MLAHVVVWLLTMPTDFIAMVFPYVRQLRMLAQARDTQSCPKAIQRLESLRHSLSSVSHDAGRAVQTKLDKENKTTVIAHCMNRHLWPQLSQNPLGCGGFVTQVPIAGIGMKCD
jgi:hypothetical protein